MNGSKKLLPLMYHGFYIKCHSCFFPMFSCEISECEPQKYGIILLTECLLEYYN